MTAPDLAAFLTARFDDAEREIAQPPIGPHGEWRLADIDAKRRIIELCVAEIDNGTDGYATAASVLYWLALPYADHPEYDERWRV